MIQQPKPRPLGLQRSLPLEQKYLTPERPAPALDYRIGCDCATCQLGKLLWWTEDDTRPWGHWFAVLEDRAHKGTLVRSEDICYWQWHRWTAPARSSGNGAESRGNTGDWLTGPDLRRS